MTKEMLIKNATKKGYLIARPGDVIDLLYPNSTTRRGRVQKEMAHTLDTTDSKGVLIDTMENKDNQNFKVRKLTPKECWRLMGIRDEDFEKASKVVSNSQLYKQAGNAIVVNVLEGIFKNLFREKRSEE